MLGTKAQQEEFITLFRDLVARGRAAAMPVIAATQRPSVDIIPKSLRDLFGYRAAFRCTSTGSSDIILGDGWSQAGFSATDISPLNPGEGFLIAEGGIPQRIKVAYLSDSDITALADYAAWTRRSGLPTPSPRPLPQARPSPSPDPPLRKGTAMKYYTTDPGAKGRFIRALRELADYLDRNPAIPVPKTGADRHCARQLRRLRGTRPGRPHRPAPRRRHPRRDRSRRPLLGRPPVRPHRIRNRRHLRHARRHRPDAHLLPDASPRPPDTWT